MSEPDTPAHDPARNPKDAIPKPPTPAELDQVSQDQALVADEWAPTPPDRPGQQR